MDFATLILSLKSEDYDIKCQAQAELDSLAESNPIQYTRNLLAIIGQADSSPDLLSLATILLTRKASIDVILESYEFVFQLLSHPIDCVRNCFIDLIYSTNLVVIVSRNEFSFVQPLIENLNTGNIHLTKSCIEILCRFIGTETIQNPEFKHSIFQNLIEILQPEADPSVINLILSQFCEVSDSIFPQFSTEEDFCSFLSYLLTFVQNPSFQTAVFGLLQLLIDENYTSIQAFKEALISFDFSLLQENTALINFCQMWSTICNHEIHSDGSSDPSFLFCNDAAPQLVPFFLEILKIHQNPDLDDSQFEDPVTHAKHCLKMFERCVPTISKPIIWEFVFETLSENIDAALSALNVFLKEQEISGDDLNSVLAIVCQCFEADIERVKFSCCECIISLAVISKTEFSSLAPFLDLLLSLWNDPNPKIAAESFAAVGALCNQLSKDDRLEIIGSFIENSGDIEIQSLPFFYDMLSRIIVDLDPEPLHQLLENFVMMMNTISESEVPLPPHLVPSLCLLIDKVLNKIGSVLTEEFADIYQTALKCYENTNVNECFWIFSTLCLTNSTSFTPFVEHFLEICCVSLENQDSSIYEEHRMDMESLSTLNMFYDISSSLQRIYEALCVLLPTIEEREQQMVSVQNHEANASIIAYQRDFVFLEKVISFVCDIIKKYGSPAAPPEFISRLFDNVVGVIDSHQNEEFDDDESIFSLYYRCAELSVLCVQNEINVPEIVNFVSLILSIISSENNLPQKELQTVKSFCELANEIVEEKTETMESFIQIVQILEMPEIPQILPQVNEEQENEEED